ncbi:MAG: AAA family ATPase, partial [Microcoleaceae cyanobacterium]
MQALRDLMGQLLSENDTQLQQWKQNILAVVGENGQVLLEVIPELELIINQQPPVAELSGNAAQNRFNLLFKKFIQVFTTKQHPLVIFLDDLQWADSASLNLIKLLMSGTDSQYLFLIGTYRDNEVNPAHPLMLTLDEIQKNQGVINTITLAPLLQHDLNQLVADTLHCSLQQALPLTQAVDQKTSCNPFFATQFLKALYEDELIYFNPKEGFWQCDLAKVKLAAVSEDVVKFVSKRLQKLDSLTQDTLKLAACIGNEFDLETLAIVRQTSELETATDLWLALKEGLILPTTEIYKFYTHETIEIQAIEEYHVSASYRFLHDRIQQAAYSLIPEEDKKETHLRIGQLLLKNTHESEQEEKIFEIVNQFNYSINLINDKSEQNKLARLNLIAGKKAQNSTAYQAASDYYNIGIQLLEEEAWQNQYKIILELYESIAEVAYLKGDFKQMEKWTDKIFEKAKDKLDTVKTYQVIIQAFAAQNKQLEAVKTSLLALKSVNINISLEPQQEEIGYALKEVNLNLKTHKINEFVDLYKMNDVYAKAAMSILLSMIPSAFQTAPALLPIIVSKSVVLSIKYGNTPESTFAYSMYGLMLCGFLGEIDLGYQFGQLALRLSSQNDYKKYYARTLFVISNNIKHWKDHIKESLPLLLNAYSSGLDSGDLEFAATAIHAYCYCSYFSAKELTKLENCTNNYSQAILEIKQKNIFNYNEIWHQLILNLIGNSENKYYLVGTSYNEKEMLKIHIESQDRTALNNLYLSKLILCYLLGDFHQAVQNSAYTEKYLDGVTGTILISVFYFYDSLAELAIYTQATNYEQKIIMDKVILNQSKMKIWATNAPMNHQHKVDLVEAEKCRVLDQKLEAMELYDQAIVGAKENEYLQEEALANELAAKFYLSLGRQKVAQTYMIEAYYCYSHWGAKAKVKDLEKRYPKLLAPILEQQKISLNPFKTIASLGNTNSHKQATISSNTTGISDALDFTSVMKASLALSSEIELNQLISQLIQVMIENAGATKGVLMLSQDSQLTVEAISTHSLTDDKIVSVNQ